MKDFISNLTPLTLLIYGLMCGILLAIVADVLIIQFKRAKNFLKATWDYVLNFNEWCNRK